MSEDEIIKYAKIFSSARGDTYKINFVNENKTIDEVEIWKEILKLIDKKDKVIDLMACELAIPGESIELINLYNQVRPDKPIDDVIKKYFYKKVEKEND